MFGEETGPETPVVRYCAVSAIENSHRNVITGLEWIPDHFEVVFVSELIISFETAAYDRVRKTCR